MGETLSYKTLRDELEAYDRKVAGWLLYHEERKKELQGKKEEIMASCLSSISYSQEPKSDTNRVHDSVANTVIKLTDIKLIKVEKEIQFVEDIIKMLPLEKRVFLRLRQKYNNTRGGRHRYNAYIKIQIEFAEEMSRITGMSEEEVWKDERTLKAWWREILDIAVRLALKRNLL